MLLGYVVSLLVPLAKEIYLSYSDGIIIPFPFICLNKFDKQSVMHNMRCDG